MAYTTIDDPSAYFQTALWTGNGSARSITLDGNSDMQPDWVWIKRRNSARNHALLDSVRGGSKQLVSNSTAAEGTDAQLITSFDSDGFSLGTSNDCNSSGDTFVGWSWKASGSTASNTDGTITSTVSANTTAGFSIVSYTGNGSAGATIGHSLGQKPDMMIIKTRDGVNHFFVYHTSLGATKHILVNETDAAASFTVTWNDTEPTSSVFSVGTSFGTNKSGDNYIGYCFTEKKGYSKIGSYTGNGQSGSSSPFIYTGFKPAWILTKNANATQGWNPYDNKRAGYNGANYRLVANTNEAEYTSEVLDILSNGFKIRTSGEWANGSGHTIIFMAFAENPFVTSTGIPTTAR